MAEWEKFDIRDPVWLRAFFRKLDAEGMPQAGAVTPPIPPVVPPVVPVPPTADRETAVRNAAWTALGIPFNPEAAFPKYARAHKLGNPVSVEFDIAGCRAQGYAGGIIWCVIGEWDKINTLAW